jgi:general L-amino acid transport system substrate-binding protein
MQLFKLVAICAALSAFSATAQAGSTFDNIKKRDKVICGVNGGVAGFSVVDSEGKMKGLDVDLCRALAAAMFGDANKTENKQLTTQTRFTALQSSEVDVLARNTTLTLTRDAALGLEGAGVNFYDSQGIMVRKALGVTSAKELGGATICVQPGTTTELNLNDWFKSQKIEFKQVVVDNAENVRSAYESGRCDALTTDKSQAAAHRSALAKPDEHLILPDSFSKEPLGPMVRQDDMKWFNVVRWTLNAMLEAEEYGITSKNVDAMLKSPNPNIQRILGVNGDLGKSLGLDNKWAYNVIKQVGNYGESFDRNLGAGSPLKLERGLNALWKDGGLHYGLPLR